MTSRLACRRSYHFDFPITQRRAGKSRPLSVWHHHGTPRVAFLHDEAYRAALVNLLETGMDHDPHKLSEAFAQLIENVPEPADKSDAIWAGAFLLRSPDVDAAELHDIIKSSGTVILREEKDLPKLEAIVARWRSLL